MMELIEGEHGRAVTIAAVAGGVWRAQLVGRGVSVDFPSLAAARLWAGLATGLLASPAKAGAARAG